MVMFLYHDRALPYNNIQKFCLTFLFRIVLIKVRHKGGRPIILTRKEMEEALRNAGCRITRQRKAILVYLASTDTHPSARQVFQEAKSRCPGLSLATVYNTLETLVKQGLVKIIDFEAMDNRLETNLNPHINLICNECGKIEDFDSYSPILSQNVIDQFGFKVQDYRMEYYGLCHSCRTQIRESP